MYSLLRGFVQGLRARIGLVLLGVAPGVAVGIVPATLHAQEMSRMPPQVVVSATEEIDVAPDRAHFIIAVETRGRTSPLAAQENARLATAVLEAVKRAGIPAAQIRTVGLTVSPEYRYPEGGGRPTVVGYQAMNSVQIELRDLSKVGAVIDAALGGGATNVSGPNFALANPDSARRVALGVAVRRAQADAEVMARAAGQKLGAVLELSSNGSEQPMYDRPVLMMTARASEAAPETPVAVGTIKVRASVTMRVTLVPAP